jgi:hypothetical protein
MPTIENNDVTVVAEAARFISRPLSDLNSMNPMLGGADVIGLGVAARGALEVPALDDVFLGIARHVIEGGKVCTIAIEDTPASGQRMTDYLAGKIDDVGQVLHGAFRPFQSQRFAEFLHQLRGRRSEVTIAGVDLDEDN